MSAFFSGPPKPNVAPIIQAQDKTEARLTRDKSRQESERQSRLKARATGGRRLLLFKGDTGVQNTTLGA